MNESLIDGPKLTKETIDLFLCLHLLHSVKCRAINISLSTLGAVLITNHEDLAALLSPWGLVAIGWGRGGEGVGSNNSE